MCTGAVYLDAAATQGIPAILYGADALAEELDAGGGGGVVVVDVTT